MDFQKIVGNKNYKHFFMKIVFFEIACYGSEERIRFWWHRPRENRDQCASENVGAPD